MTTPDHAALTRWGLICLGWICVGLGLAGIVLPVLPTTPFLLVALWAFSRSSPVFHRWLLDHRLFGPPLRRWEDHRVIPVRVKIIALCGMGSGMVWVTFFSAAPWYAALIMGIIVAYGAWTVLRHPSRIPQSISIQSIDGA